MTAMFNHLTRRAIGATVVAAGLLLIASGRTSATAAGDFGDHVSTCAQTAGFTADHNPGMHRGFSGWDPTHTC